MVKRYRTLIVICICALAFPATVAGVELKGVTVTDDDRITRIVVQLDKPADYRAFLLKNPPRLVIDLLNTVNVAARLTERSKNVERLRHALHPEQIYRLVFDLPGAVTYQHQAVVIQPAAAVGYHVILEMRLVSQGVPSAVEQPSVETKPSVDLRDAVIVIDPGHGGKDSGAIGKAGSYEKHVVLEASKRLRRMLDAQFGIRSYLTRSNDRYISLRERIKIARRHSADVFISIHVDSLPEHKDVRGAAVYMLSGGSASSEAARWLVQRHSADRFVDGASIRNKDRALALILMDFSQTAIMEHSKQLARKILDTLARKTLLRTRKIESAGFAVLTSPDIPSLLIELGYLSNAEDERRLNNAAYQKILIQAVAEGIRNYLQAYAPSSSWFQRYTFEKYTVQAGDSLWALARRNQVNVDTIKQVSGVASERIFVGQRLLLPVKKNFQ